jgi:hypothetical protein
MIIENGSGSSTLAGGLWSRPLPTRTTIVHPMFATRDGAGFGGAS